MKKTIALLFVILLAACAPTGGGEQASGGDAPLVATVPAVSVPALTLASVMGATYQPSETLQGPFQLQDGAYQDANAGIQVQVLEDWIIFGDLNADGAGDAATLVSETYGGTGIFVHLVVFLNEGGRPLQLKPILLGDRVQPRGMQIDGDEITVGLTVHGPNDPLCCPTQLVNWTYILFERRLIRTGVTGELADGRIRAITIREPAFGASVPAQVRLAGDCTIAPFENTLVYRVLDMNDTLLAQGPLMVSAPDMGAPGTFDAAIDLSAAPGGLLRIEVVDISMADSSTLASDSVFVLK